MPALYLPRGIPMITVLFTFLSFYPIALAASPTVTVLNPLKDQLPPVARINNPWSWAPSLDTFDSTDGNLEYTTSPLPSWMFFDSTGLTFAGTPLDGDEGVPEVIVTAHGSSSSASSSVTFCVSKDIPLTPKLPIAAQFRTGNPSLSSVFLLSPGSSLATSGNPILRIPSGWSFSIGFEPKTYVAEPNDRGVYYGIRQANGNRLPDWMSFDRQILTLNGVVPSVKKLSTPATFLLELHGSTQEACSAASMRFDIVIATHELSATASMPTINATTTKPFNISLNSPADFSGVFVDGKPIQPQNITNLTINVPSHESWLQYNPASRSLVGNPKSEKVGQKSILPVTIRTNFNQSIGTNVSVALVPSYFTQAVFPAIYAAPGDKISFDLARYSSNLTFEERDDVNLSVTYEPTDIGTWFELSGRLRLKGTVPDNHPAANVSITFIAFAHITHSTSHARLPVHVVASGANKGHGGLSKTHRARLVLALAITFALLGALCIICGILAFMKRVRTRRNGAEGRPMYSEKDRAPWWPDVVKFSDLGKRSERHKESGSQMLAAIPDRFAGLELHRVQERSGKPDHNFDYGTSSYLPGLTTMNKCEFFAKLRNTVRRASKKCPLKRSRSTGAGSSQEGPLHVQANSMAVEKGVLSFEAMTNKYPVDQIQGLAKPGHKMVSFSPFSFDSTASCPVPQRPRNLRTKLNVQNDGDQGNSLLTHFVLGELIKE